MSFKISVYLLLIVLGISILIIGLGGAFIPLVTAGLLAYLFFPLIKRLEKIKIKRQYVVLFLFIVVITLIVWGLLIVIPTIIEEIQIFITVLPDTLSTVVVKLTALANQYGIEWKIDKNTLLKLLKEHLDASSLKVALSAALTLQHALTNVLGSLIIILKLFLFPLFFFYIIGDYELIVEKIKSLIPLRFLLPLQNFIAKINVVLSGYIRGQLLVAIILAVLYSTGLWIVGLPFGLLIGVMTGLLSIIPYVGFTLGFMTSLIVAIATTSSVGTVIAVIAVFVIVQCLESFVITPKLVGHKVGLAPLVTILALIIGGNLLGFWGILFAIPLAAIVKIIFFDLVKYYKKSRFYNDINKE